MKWVMWGAHVTLTTLVVAELVEGVPGSVWGGWLAGGWLSWQAWASWSVLFAIVAWWESVGVIAWEWKWGRSPECGE